MGLSVGEDTLYSVHISICSRSSCGRVGKRRPSLYTCMTRKQKDIYEEAIPERWHYVNSKNTRTLK